LDILSTLIDKRVNAVLGINSEKPKYQLLKEHIIQEIESRIYKPGDKILSENELAEKFNISRHTVRQAIGELVVEGWLCRVQGKGTFVGRKLNEKGDKSRTIGVITTYLDDYIFPSIIRGIDGILSSKGYNIVLTCTYNQHDNERVALENLLRQNISGLIAEPTKSAIPNPNIDLYHRFEDSGIPLLFIHGAYKQLDSSFIVEDDTEAGYIAAKHLIDEGHRKIGGIFKIDDIQGHYRFSGFHKALLEAGISLSESKVLWFDTDDKHIKLSSDSGQLDFLLEQCTAVVCYNDQVSLRIIDFIRKKGLSVPEDLSIVSFDDSQLSVASEVKLTTVAHPKEVLGELAAKTIIDMISGSERHYNIKIKPELVVRSSTKNINRR